MRKQREIFALREIERIYQNCPKQVAFYVGRKWMFLVIGWFLMFVAGVLGYFELVSGGFGLVIELFIAVLGGCAVGLAVLFTVASKWIPYLVRHTALQEQEIRKRLEELNNA